MSGVVLFKILRSVNVIARRWVNDVAGAVIRLLYAYRLTGVLTITTDAEAVNLLIYRWV